VAVCGPRFDSWTGYLPADEFQRQRLSPAGSAFRGAQPAQRFGSQPRGNGSGSHRQREVFASRGAGSRAGCESVPGAVFGLHGDISKVKNLREAKRFLPDNIYSAIDDFRNSAWTTTLLGEDVKGRYADLKQASADRCPRLLGTIVKAAEVQFHHEIYNQLLWNKF
jgi:hypothetical protein